ncbi:hypothetical protein RHOFW104T7_17490 [Rhodanobacter thiooxydans]|uniref:Uncharacterized protein n=1 Tax=Rhodanobacter thiooxydans TaxID=416169 RepID=A0A154QF94_9GAMM|nr:hypothetical protein RHOFW104T7_17490 [Rhodanobacter thiooxydans]
MISGQRSRWPENARKKGRLRGLFRDVVRLKSALASLETGVALADHEHLAATTHNLAVAMPRLGGLQRVKHLHGQLLTLD